MKISYNWLKSCLPFNETPEEVSEILTQCGLEVESTEVFESVRGGLKGVITGEVLKCEPHPNADKLCITLVNTGFEKPLRIVCGAPNVAAGQKVLVATVGTTLWINDKALEIKTAKIRGELSEGMICAEDELGLGSSHDGIMVLPGNTAVGIPAAELFNVQSDHIFEIGLTPNRPDATSHLGVARDLAAAINADKDSTLKLLIPDVSAFSVDNHSMVVDVIIDDEEACPRYSGLCFSNIEVKESPQWLKERLQSVGFRPINNVVDVTNLVLMECGQPLHAFDMKAVNGGKVIIRKAREGEAFTTLDEAKRTLTSSDLMICNEKDPMCIAGVFGGLNSGVSGETTALFLESAYFSPEGIRRTSKHHGLKTDASFRYERGADPNITVYALKRAAILLQEICGARISSDIIDIYPRRIHPVQISLRYERLNKITGKLIPREKVRSILTDLGFAIIESGDDQLSLLAPTAKADICREVDVIEEVLRIYGFNNIEIPSRMMAAINSGIHDRPEVLRNTMADYLAVKGYHECMNVSLANAKITASYLPGMQSEIVMLKNPLSRELNSMRQTLLFNALENVCYNINRKNLHLKLFEFGKVYFATGHRSTNVRERYLENEMLSLTLTGNIHPESWEAEERRSDLFDLKRTASAALLRIGIDTESISPEDFSDKLFARGSRFPIGGNVLMTIGSVSKELLKEYDIRQEVLVALINWDLAFQLASTSVVSFSEIPRFPEVRRDLSLVMDESQSFYQIRKIVLDSGGSLVKNVRLFDVYEGDNLPSGKKSYAISLSISDPAKTLTDSETEAVMTKVIKALKTNAGIELR